MAHEDLNEEGKTESHAAKHSLLDWIFSFVTLTGETIVLVHEKKIIFEFARSHFDYKKREKWNKNFEEKKIANSSLLVMTCRISFRPITNSFDWATSSQQKKIMNTSKSIMQVSTQINICLFCYISRTFFLKVKKEILLWCIFFIVLTS